MALSNEINQMKIKEEAKELEALLKTTAQAQSQQEGIVDDTPEELEPEPLFDIDYDKCKSSYIVRAKHSIKKIVKAVMPNPEKVDTQFIKDKIAQDAEQLGFLYYQQHLAELMQQASIESVRTGNVSPRMLETFTELARHMTTVSKQIADFQISIKENYAKIKFDAMETLPDMEDSLDQTSHGATPKALEQQHIFIGSADLNKDAQNAKLKYIKEHAAEMDMDYSDSTFEEDKK